MARHSTESADGKIPVTLLSDILGEPSSDGEDGALTRHPIRIHTGRHHSRPRSRHNPAHERRDRSNSARRSGTDSSHEGHRGHERSNRGSHRHKGARQNNPGPDDESTDQEQESGPKIKGVKSLYTTSTETCACCIRWSEYADPESENRNLIKLASRYEVVHRQQRQKAEQGAFFWTTHSIIVRGDFKKDIIDTACSDYPDLLLLLDEVEFTPPFKPIVHRWDTIRTLVEGLSVSTGREENSNHVQQAPEALHALESAISSSLDTLKILKSTRRIDFGSLWMVFAPSELVFFNESGVEQIMRIRSFETAQNASGMLYWKAECDYLDWNGQDTGLATTVVPIRQYHGSRLITSLSLVPLAWLPQEKELVQRMIARGRRFEALRGYHFKHCQGTRLVEDGYEVLTKPVIACPLFDYSASLTSPPCQVNGRVVIDSAAFYRCQKMAPPSLKSSREVFPADIIILSDEEAASFHREMGYEEKGEAEEKPGGGEYGEEDFLDCLAEGRKKRVPLQNDFVREDVLVSLSDDQAMIANPRVRGMDLTSKEWCKFTPILGVIFHGRTSSHSCSTG